MMHTVQHLCRGRLATAVDRIRALSYRQHADDEVIGTWIATDPYCITLDGIRKAGVREGVGH